MSESYAGPGDSFHKHINPKVLPPLTSEILRGSILKVNQQFVTVVNDGLQSALYSYDDVIIAIMRPMVLRSNAL